MVKVASRERSPTSYDPFGPCVLRLAVEPVGIEPTLCPSLKLAAPEQIIFRVLRARSPEASHTPLSERLTRV